MNSLSQRLTSIYLSFGNNTSFNFNGSYLVLTKSKEQGGLRKLEKFLLETIIKHRNIAIKV